MSEDVTATTIRHRYPADGYVAFHAPRYAALLRLLDAYVTAESLILDVGRSRLTEMMHNRFRARTDTLGFVGDEASPEGTNWWFDLNRASDERSWRTDLPKYDVIVMAEVIEHLHTAPRPVLAFLRSLLKPAGVLVIQTPNAVALHKRLEMAIGRNPYERIREGQEDPGHFREYTKAELEELVREAGFRVESWHAYAYLDYRYVRHDVDRPNRAAVLVNLVYLIAPPRLRPGQTLVARRADGDL